MNMRTSPVLRNAMEEAVFLKNKPITQMFLLT